MILIARLRAWMINRYNRLGEWFESEESLVSNLNSHQMSYIHGTRTRSRMT